MHAFQTLDDIDVSGKTVLVRADLNVPMQGGRITDDTRLQRSLPTLRDLIARRARVVVVSHFGRPNGRYDADDSLAPLVDAMNEALEGVPVSFGADCIGAEARDAIHRTGPGEVAVLENLRFHAEETANDPAFASALAGLADIYVNDAFSCAHRAHASIVGIAAHLPAVAGRLMQAELEALERMLEQPDPPLAAIVGGAKVSTKIPMLRHLAGKVQTLIIGGAMANTFLYAQGYDVASSLCEKDLAETARAILAEADAQGCRILLPEDVVVATSLGDGGQCAVVGVDKVPGQTMILDIGPLSAARLSNALATHHTLIWNGPVGAFEHAPFDVGTSSLARAAAGLTRAGKLQTIAGGGDTVAALSRAGLYDEFSYMSTAGGAFLAWLEGHTLPGVAALTNTREAA